jgi:hypothetical protein
VDCENRSRLFVVEREDQLSIGIFKLNFLFSGLMMCVQDSSHTFGESHHTVKQELPFATTNFWHREEYKLIFLQDKGWCGEAGYS